MKTIIKTQPNASLQTAKDNRWDWDEFHTNMHQAYLDCRNQALDEQAGECAYTGLWLGEGSNQKLHLDHFKKRSIYPDLTFCWDNLFAAAKDLDYGADYKDNVIHGPKSNSDIQYNSIISPTNANLKHYFWYRQDGTIEPTPALDLSNDRELLNRIRNTIDVFNLNAADLKSRRKGIIESIRNLNQLDDDVIISCMMHSGFSFVIEFELHNR